MTLRHRYTRWAAFVLLAAGACLAAATPAASQQNLDLERPRLLNEAEIELQGVALHPAALRDRGTPGEVLLRFRVLEDSTVDSATITVLQATNAAFVEPARALARVMRFAPARLKGRPVAAWLQHQVQIRSAPRPPVSPDAPIRFVPPDEGTYELSAVEVHPRPVNIAQLRREMERRYAAALGDSGVSGALIVRFRILENGSVDPTTGVAVLSTNPAAEEPTITSLRLLRFTPARVNGRPVKVWVELPISWDAVAPPAAPANPPATPGGGG